MEISSELNLELDLDLDQDLPPDLDPDLDKDKSLEDRPNLPDRFVSVLVDCIGIDDLLTYRLPHDLELQVGDILSVPLGNRQVGAIAIAIDNNLINNSNQNLTNSPSSQIDSEINLEVNPETNPEIEIKPISAVVSSGIFPPRYWELLKRMADYYRTPLMQSIKVALPPKLLDQSHYRIKVKRQIENSELATEVSEIKLPKAAQMVWDFLQGHLANSKGISRRYIYQKLGRYAGAGLKELQKLDWIETVLELPQRPQPRYEDLVILIKAADAEVTQRQGEILTVLQHQGGECLKAQLCKLAKTSVSTIQLLESKGYVTIAKRESLRLGGKSHTVTRDCPKVLNSDQEQALQSILKAIAEGQASQFLLHGVTGSGKTEVYLQAIAPVLTAGKSALVLVPEIGLTPQLTDRFRARFGDARVNVYHSQLSEGERFDTWRLMLTQEPQVVIGTRSAVFAPLPNLGLIVMDEEHDQSFKQDQPQPCYHARTIAQWRSQLEQIPLVLGSATPSAEMIAAHNQAKAIALTMPDRIGGKPMPPIEIVDMRDEFQAGNYSILSRKLQAAIAAMLAAQQQGILFIHRRGYSTFVSCRSCGYVAKCSHCDVSLSYHDPITPTTHQPQAAHLRCHYCNYTQLQPKSCPECGSPYFKHFGSGTQKVEQELAKLFPNIRLIRFDSDTTRNKDQHRLLIDQFRSGAADLLVGTQMLTKGLDIPQVTLVGVVSADGLLNFSDYRAGERAAQTLLQVAGRAGRGEEEGKVIMQTYTPEHPAIQAVQSYQLAEFMEMELEMRSALRYPPTGQMALIHLSSENAQTVETAAHELAEYLRQLESNWDVLGATPAAIAKIANRYRWQIMLKFLPDLLPNVPTLEELRMLVGNKSVRVAIDVDPLMIL